MKIKLLLVSLVCMQYVYGSDAIALLQDANQCANELVKIMISEPKITNAFPLVIVPEAGNLLHIHDYQVKYPVSVFSMPQAIEHHHAHKNLLELPVLQQNRGVWNGDSVDIGTFGGSNKIYTMAQLQRADGLNCGYHAIKNVIYMIAAFKKLELGFSFEAHELLYRMQDIPSFTWLLKSWLQRVIPYRYESNRAAYDAYPLGNFPVGLDLEKIIGEGGNQPLIPQLLEELFDDGLHAHICIVDSFLYLKDVNFITDKYLDFLQKVITSKNGMYGFVVNDAASKDLATARGSHWFGYVLWKKDGRAIWLYTDSSFGRHDIITDELIRICSQSTEHFDQFKEARIKKIIEVPFAKIDQKLHLLDSIKDAYRFKFSCNKLCTLRDAIFIADDFKDYNKRAELVDDALVAKYNQLWQVELQMLSFVSPREATWQFSFWHKEKDNSWKITYLDKKKIYDRYVYFHLPDGYEDITILSGIPDQIFSLLLKEPMDKIVWNDAIARKVIHYMNLTINKVLLHKEFFVSEYDSFIAYKEAIFEKIQKDLGDDVLRADMVLYESKLEQLLMLD